MKTSLLALTWFLTLTIARAADAPALAELERLAVAGQLDSTNASFVIQGRLKPGDDPATPPIYAAHLTARQLVAARTNTQTAELKTRIYQGKLRELVLTLTGDGEIARVTGTELKDWSVRHGAEGVRYLVLRPVHPDRATNEFNVSIETRQVYDVLPATLSPLAFAPDNAALFDGTLTVEGSPEVEVAAARLTGLAPLQTAPPTDPTQAPPLAFRFAGSRYDLQLALRDADPDARRVRLDHFQLTGALLEQTATFRLTATAALKHAAGGSLAVLCGDAALTRYPAGLTLTYSNGCYTLLFPRAGTFPLELEFDARVQAQDGWKQLNFGLAPSALRPLVLQGLPADTQLELAGAAQPERSGTNFLSYLGAAGPLSLRWKDAKPETEGRLFYAVQGNVQMAVGTGLLREAHAMEFKVMQGELTRLSFDLAGEGEVTRVTGDHILSWRVEPVANGPGRRLVVQLNEPQKDQCAVVIQTQSPLGTFPLKVQPLRVTPVDAIRFGGHVLVTNDGAVRLEVSETRGLSQVSVELVPQTKDLLAVGAASRGQGFAYRFSGTDFSLAIQADHIQPELSVSQLLLYHLAETETRIEAEIEVEIREAPLREFTLQIPAEYAVSQLNVAQLSDYFVTPAGEPGRASLRLVFGQPLAGRQVIHLRLERNQDLRTNVWSLPALRPPQVKSVRGYLGVTADVGLRLTPGRIEGLTELASAFFPRKVAGLQFAYRLREEAWQAALNVERQTLSVQVDAFHLFSIGEGIAYGSTVLNYVISGTPLGTLKFAAPPEYSNVEFAGRDVRSWKKVEQGYEVYLNSPAFGAYTLLATFDRKFNPVGETLGFTGLRPTDVQSEQGTVAVVTEYQFEVRTAEQTPNLLPLEPAEIPADQRLLFSAPLLAAYRYPARPFSLQLALRPLSQGETVRQVIDRAYLTTRVSREGEAVTRAQYLLKSQGLPHLRLTVPADVRLWEARVNDAKVVPVADGPDTLIPLPQRPDASAPLRLDLRVASKSGSKERVTVQLPAVGGSVLFTQWSVEPDEAQTLRFRQGSVAPTNPGPDRSGFAWLRRLAAGTPDESSAVALGWGLAALFVSALCLRWATRPGTSRRGARNLAGLIAGLGTTVLAAYCLLGLAVHDLDHASPTQGPLTFLAPMLEAGKGWQVELENLALADAGFSVWSLWPVPLVLCLWLAVWWRTEPGILRAVGVFAGWGLLAWALLRLPQGGPAFFVLVLGFHALHVWFPAWRCQRGLAPKAAPGGPAPGAGATAGATAVALALLLGPSVLSLSAADAPARGVEPRQSVRRLTQDARVKEGFVFSTARMTWKAEAGQALDFLRAPAVLTSFKTTPAALQLTELPAGAASVYRLVARETGEFTIEFAYQVALPQQTGTNGFALPTQPALVNRLRLEFERAEVDVVSPQAMSVRTTRTQRAGAEVTQAELVLAPAAQAWIGWQPRARDIRSETAVFYAELQQLHVPAAGLIEGAHDIHIRPAQGQLGDLAFEVPTGLTITDVQAEFVSGWRFDPDTHALQVRFRVPQTRPFVLRLRSQLAASPLPYEQSIAVLRVLGAAGQVGTLGLATSGEVQLDQVTETNLAPINLEDFAAKLVQETAAQTPGLTLRRAFRYAEPTARLALKASAVEPDVRVQSQETLSLGEDRVVLAVQLAVTVSRAGVFKLSFPLPADLEVESLSGPALSHWTEFATDGQRVVTLHLKAKTEGECAFALTLGGPGMLRRTQYEAPRLVLREAGKHTGQLVLVPELGLRLHAAAREGVTQLDPQKAGIPQKGVLAFRLLHARWQLNFDVESVDPWIEAAVLQDVTVREGPVQVAAQVNYQIDNAGVKSLQLTLPAAAENVRFQGEHIADSIRQASATNTVAWELKLQRRVIGAYPLRVTYQLPVSSPTEVVLTGLRTLGTNLERGYLAVRAGGRLQVRVPALPEALQPLDWPSVPAALRRGLDSAEAKDTFRVIAPNFTLRLAVSRHEVARLLPARVERVDLTSVVSRSGLMLTEVRLALQPGDKRLLKLKLPPDSRFWHARLNQESTAPWQEGDALLLRLEKNSDASKPALVEFLYSSTVERRGLRGFTHQLVGPQFDLPLENIAWQVYVPESWRLDDWQSTLQLLPDQPGAEPALLALQSYLDAETQQQRTKSKDAESLLQLGNKLIEQGVPQQARKAFESAYRLSQHDAAFNEDARVQLNNLKLQQVVVGLNNRRLNVQSAGTAVADTAAAATAQAGLGQTPDYTQQQVQQMLLSNTAEDNSALMKLAERLVRQQDAAMAKPEAIKAALPRLGHLLTFTGSLQVDPWADLQVKLDTEVTAPGTGGRHFGVWSLSLLGLIFLAALGRRPAPRTD